MNNRLTESLLIINKWSIQCSNTFRQQLSNFLLTDLFNNTITTQFLIRLSNDSNLATQILSNSSILISGSLFFIGSIGISLSQGLVPSNLDHIFSFTSLYMLLDNYIDDNSIPLDQRLNLIKQLSILVNDNCYTNNPLDIINLITKYYSSIITDIPSSRYYLQQCYTAEIISMKLQTDQLLSRSTYWILTIWKGGTAVQAIQSILQLPVTIDEYHLGACIQCIDDILDLTDDLQSNINTVATFDHKANGVIDQFFFETLFLINDLSSKYTLFKPILIGLLLYSLSRSHFYSPELYQSFKDYIPVIPNLSYTTSFYQQLLSIL